MGRDRGAGYKLGVLPGSPISGEARISENSAQRAARPRNRDRDRCMSLPAVMPPGKPKDGNHILKDGSLAPSQ
jgi:hypothetical protein